MSLREDLENLLKSPGWLWLVNDEKDWWNSHLSSHVAACANDTNDVAALNKLRQVVAAKDAVERFMRKPDEKLKALVAKEAPALTSEADLLVYNTGMYSRRGGF